MDVTITATLRPGILRRSLESWAENAFSTFPSPLRAVVNIDPVGEDGACPMHIMELIRDFFDEGIVRVPPDPGFPRAWIWTWLNVKAPWCLHIEDDWELLYPVNLKDMVEIVMRHPELAVLRLPYHDAEGQSVKQWSDHFLWNGDYFQCPKEARERSGFSGHPSLIRKTFIQQCLPWLHPAICPEKTLKGWHPYVRAVINAWEYGVHGQPGCPAAIRDLGWEWLEAQGLKKDRGPFFLTWHTPGYEVTNAAKPWLEDGYDVEFYAISGGNIEQYLIQED